MGDFVYCRGFVYSYDSSWNRSGLWKMVIGDAENDIPPAATITFGYAVPANEIMELAFSGGGTLQQYPLISEKILEMETGV